MKVFFCIYSYFWHIRTMLNNFYLIFSEQFSTFSIYIILGIFINHVHTYTVFLFTHSYARFCNILIKIDAFNPQFQVYL